jgi:hypothetical protein
VLETPSRIIGRNAAPARDEYHAMGFKSAANDRFTAITSDGCAAGSGRLLSVTTLLPVSDPLRTVAQRSKLRTFYLAKTSVLSRLGKSQV